VGIWLETARLIIRTFEPRDADAWLALVTDRDVRRYLPAGPAPTRDTFCAGLERRHAMERDRGFAMWAVDAKDTGIFIGQCGLYPVEGTGPEIEIAYHYTKASWGKGYGTEAASAVLAYGLGQLRLERVIALVMPENVGSCHVVEKAGMRFESMATYYGVPNLCKYVAVRDRS
jgi:RimJ/RimL family protein N-acetyltransferase